jgi:hypothetical protein
MATRAVETFKQKFEITQTAVSLIDTITSFDLETDREPNGNGE